MKFEDVLAEVDGCGRFQLRTILLLVIPRITLPFNFLLNNFIAAIPSHHCDFSNFSSLEDGGTFGNLTQEQRLAVSIPVQEDGTPSSCQMFREPQYHLLFNSTNSIGLPAVVPCPNGWVFDNTTFKSTLATEWDLVCDRKSMNRYTATIFFMGVMLGAIVIGNLTDRFGRKTMLLVSYLIALVFGFASAFSDSFIMFAFMRFFAGFGFSGISNISIVLCLEWVDIKHRTPIGVLVGTDWSFFNAVLPGVAYLVNDWRYLTAVTTSPLVLAVLTWWWIPESARWLIANGQVTKAHFYLSQCAKVNNREQFMADIQLENLSETAENENRTYSYLDVVRTPKMRRLALITCFVWFGVAGTYYGISLNVSGFGVDIYTTQFIYGVIELPAKACIYYSLTKIGRRVNQVATLSLTGLCVISTAFIPKEMALFRTVVAVLGKGFSEASFVVVYLYTMELYPTVLRQNGLGCSSALARLAVSLTPLISNLDDVWFPLPNIIFCLMAFSAALLAFLLPETANVRLPETIEDIEQT